VETDVIALVPSGAGATWGLMMAEGNPAGFKSMRVSGEGITEKVGMDIFHPFISLMQTAMAPADPASFMRHIILEPFPGRKAKNVWLAYGQFDEYFAPSSQAAIITGLGLDLMGDVNDGTVLELMGMTGKQVQPYPVSGNIKTKSGERVTGVAVQYEQVGPLDGHHINFQRTETKYQYGCFLYSLIKDGTPTMYAPKEPWQSTCGE
jgi:hypothetical protein